MLLGLNIWLWCVLLDLWLFLIWWFLSLMWFNLLVFDEIECGWLNWLINIFCKNIEVVVKVKFLKWIKECIFKLFFLLEKVLLWICDVLFGWF